MPGLHIKFEGKEMSLQVERLQNHLCLGGRTGQEPGQRFAMGWMACRCGGLQPGCSTTLRVRRQDCFV